MKKFYNEPKMNISLFVEDTIITGSAETDLTAAQKGENYLLSEGATTVKTIEWAF